MSILNGEPHGNSAGVREPKRTGEVSKKMHSKVVIIGSGPGGHTAAIYLARANLEPVLYEVNTHDFWAVWILTTYAGYACQRVRRHRPVTLSDSRD